MGTIYTKEEMTNVNQQVITAQNVDGGSITPATHGGVNDDIITNMYEGIPFGPPVLMTGNLTYSAKLHRKAIITVSENLSGTAVFTFPGGLTKYDRCLIDNQSGFSVSLIAQGQIFNRKDGQRVTIIQAGGYMFVTKKNSAAATSDFVCWGEKLSQVVTFASNATYPKTTNTTTTGGTFEGNFNKNFQYWILILTNNAAPPDITAIKLGTSGLGGFTNTGNANTTKQTPFAITGAVANTDYDIYWAADPTDGSIDATVTGKIDFKTAAAPVAGDVQLRSHAFLKQGSGISSLAFTCNVDGVSTSVMIVALRYRAGTGNPVTSLTIGGKNFTKIAEMITPGTNNPNYDYVFMQTKAGMPTNATGVAGTIGASSSPSAMLTSLSMNIIILEGAQQVIIPGNQVKAFGSTGIIDHTHNFSSLPAKYMLISVGSTNDPNDTVTLSFPSTQTELTKGQDTEKVSSCASYKVGTAATNSMSVEMGNSTKLNHIAIQVNPS